MRVAIVHNLLPGGAHRRLSEQARRLPFDVVEVCLSTSAPVTDDPIVVDYRPLAPSVVRPARPPLRYSDLVRLRMAWARAAASARRLAPDIVFANPCRFLQAPAALLAAVAPSVYFCDEPRRVDYELDAASARNPTTRGVYHWLYGAERRLDRSAVQRATRLATNSRYSAARILQAYGLEADVVPMGVPDGFVPGPGSPRHVLSVGTLIPDKGHELVLAAAALTPSRPPVLVIAPRPDGREEARLRGLAGKLGVSFELRIGVDDSELRLAYCGALATLYLARAEPFGLVSLEAQACGSPVIVAAEGGLPETVIDGQTGWVVERTPEAAAVRLHALSNTRLRAEMGAAAAAFGGAATWERSARVLEALLEETCASQS